MSVLIKSMEMPMSGRILIVFPSGRVLEVSADVTQDIFRETKAVSVPPHGRLIDADALNYTMLYKENWVSGTGTEAPAVWKKDIDAAPTIIEADEGE